MAELAYVSPREAAQTRAARERTWQDRIRQARADRERFEPYWLIAMSFAAGKQWVRYDRYSRELFLPEEYEEADIYVTDIIGEFRQLALGELAQDDDRPQLLLAQQDESAQEIAEHLNQAIGYAWEHEWDADFALAEARRYCVDLGTGGIRSIFDPHAGPVRQRDVPFQNGRPLLRPEEARTFVAEQQQRGESANLRTIHEGRTRWEPLSPWHLLTPPGVHHEKFFPWEIVVRPRPIDEVSALYPHLGELREDRNISSVFGESTMYAGSTRTSERGEQPRERLRDHVWVYTCYERPCPKYPLGRTDTLVTSTMRLADEQDELPYVRPDGTHASGLAYLHWDRITGQFWSRGIVEKIKDPQRLINRRRTQQVEIVDRGMPRMFVEEGSYNDTGSGKPMALEELKAGAPKPEFFSGMGPGEWMYKDVQEFREDAERAAGIRAVRLGENPVGVPTYSALAQLNETDQIKREEIYREQRAAVARLIEAGVWDIRRYWPEEKQILVGGSEGQIAAAKFAKSQIPDFFVVEIARGSVKPRTQAAKLRLVEDLWIAARDSQVVAMNPQAWIEWYYDSIEAGEPLDLPTEGANVHQRKAHLENALLSQGEFPPVDYFDPHELHIILHRASQIECEVAGNVVGFDAHEAHIIEHMEKGAETQAQIAGVAPQLAPEVGETPNGRPQSPAPLGP